MDFIKFSNFPRKNTMLFFFIFIHNSISSDESDEIAKNTANLRPLLFFRRRLNIFYSDRRNGGGKM